MDTTRLKAFFTGLQSRIVGELEAFDGGEPIALTGSTTITVLVEDANDHAPTFERPVVTIMVIVELSVKLK